MSKIVFFCIPAHGHTNPTLGVVRELVNRGHQVWYYSYNAMREKIESAGANFISCDDYDMEQKLTSKDATRVGKDLAFSTKILVDTTLALDDKVCEDMERMKPDCIATAFPHTAMESATMQSGCILCISRQTISSSARVVSTSSFVEKARSLPTLAPSFGDMLSSASYSSQGTKTAPAACIFSRKGS